MDIDNEGKDVDQKNFRGIIGSLLYLTASRPDISFAVGVCARFQAKPKESHLSATKKIWRYLKGTQSVGLWYPKEGSFYLVGYLDADFAGCRIDRKRMSTGSEVKTTITEKRKKETEILHDPLINEGALNKFLASSQHLQNLLCEPTEQESRESFHSVGNTIGYAKEDSVLERSDSYDYSPSSTPPKFPSPLKSTASSKKKGP
ncbi:PREDICTED: uncharacterized protein LOC109163128 [Ipomoea nil]|uniref:uncharacterized protein LOC109163128 n=1 Tax=Ipomoea nil TaxID=35883 RepID=UPI000900942D|nr:PREDICTED: uncharacterized protein LOC109163128 [Ipomoea nil]